MISPSEFQEPIEEAAFRLWHRDHKMLSVKVARESWTWTPASQKAPYLTEATEYTMTIANAVLEVIERIRAREAK